jgi:hypothetical protein
MEAVWCRFHILALNSKQGDNSMHRPALQVDFLLWLDRFVGTWKCRGKGYMIDRRPDGWLQAWSSSYKSVSLKWLLANGKRVEPPPSPLGLYPVVISQDMMKLWLKPEEFQHLREAWRVSSGMKLILRAIERSIRECDDETRREKFGQTWATRRGGQRWTQEDSEFYKARIAEYRSGA